MLGFGTAILIYWGVLILAACHLDIAMRKLPVTIWRYNIYDSPSCVALLCTWIAKPTEVATPGWRKLRGF